MGKADTEEEKGKFLRRYFMDQLRTVYPGQYETKTGVYNRGQVAKKKLQEFVKELRGKGVKGHVFVVTHSQFLMAFTSGGIDENGDYINWRYYNNCEILEYNLKY